MTRYPPSFTELGWNTPGTHFDSDHLSDAGSIFQRLDGIPKPGSIALRRLVNAALRDNIDDQVIDRCIALGALCGVRGEVTYKLSMRIAALLTITGRTNDLTTKELTNRVKQIYELRSRLVHGDDPGKHGTVTLGDGATVDSLNLLTQLVRSCLLATVDRPDIANMKALDESMIEGLRTNGN